MTRGVFAVALVATFLGMAVPFHRSALNELDDVYLMAARRMTAGETLYPPGGPYTYPPFMAWAFVPLTWLPRLAARFAWYLISWAGLLSMGFLAWKMAWPKGRFQPSWGQTLGVLLIASLVGMRFAFNSLSHHQTDLVLGGLVLLGCWWIIHSHDLAAALALGTAAAMKCTPLLWCVYFAAKRKWLPAAVVAATALAWNLAPELTHPTEGTPRLQEWATRYLAPMSHADHYPGLWASHVLNNQSIAGTFHAWCLTTWKWTPAGFELSDRLAPPRPWQLKLPVYGAILVVLLTLLWRLSRTCLPRYAPQPDNQVQPIWIAEFGMVICAMLLLSPMSSKAHFGILFLPALSLAWAAVVERRRWATLWLIVAVLLQVWSLNLWGLSISSLAMWHGAVTWGTLCLFIGSAALTIPASSAVSPPIHEERPETPRLAA
jgi:hypothetical protein